MKFHFILIFWKFKETTEYHLRSLLMFKFNAEFLILCNI